MGKEFRYKRRVHFAGTDIGWPRLSAALEFRNPLRFEEEFEVWVRIAELKTRTIEYEFTLVRGKSVIAVGTMTSICVRKQPDGTMRATEIPAEIADKLEPYTADPES